MATPVPNSSWGNTFTTASGATASVSAVVSKGDIDYDTLNRTRFRDGVEFTRFYEIIKDFVLARLGEGIIRVELTPFQIYTAIDEAISVLDYHAPWFCTNFMTFSTSSGVNSYKLPRHVLNNLQYVVYKKSLLSVATQNNTLEIDFFIRYFQDNFLFRDFSVADFMLLQQHLEQIRKVLGREGSFDVVNNEYLFLYPTPLDADNEEVIVQFRAIDSNTLHPFLVNWIQNYALAISEGILGQIRSKYQDLPSPGGGARLNGELLIKSSEEAKKHWMEVLITEIEEPPVFTLY